jgi:hypothetical protein
MSLANESFATSTAASRRGPGRPRGDSLEHRRRHLLDTAHRLIVERGMDEDERHAAELEALALAGRPWHEQLERLAMHVARRICRPELMRLCDIVIETGDRGLVEALVRAGPAKVKDPLAGALAHALASGHAHEPYPLEDLCDHFIGCMTGPRFGTARRTMAAPELARRGLDLFLRALAAPGSPSSIDS